MAVLAHYYVDGTRCKRAGTSAWLCRDSKVTSKRLANSSGVRYSEKPIYHTYHGVNRSDVGSFWCTLRKHVVATVNGYRTNQKIPGLLFRMKAQLVEEDGVNDRNGHDVHCYAPARPGMSDGTDYRCSDCRGRFGIGLSL